MCDVIDSKRIQSVSDEVDLSSTHLCGRVLDIGGGGEAVIAQFAGEGVIAIDISRKELDEAPDAGLKIVMDARDMAFTDNMFDTVTSFFSLMYMRPEDVVKVLRECRRVLRPNGYMHIWDTEIPQNTGLDKDIYAIMLNVLLPSRTISTGYGTGWDKSMFSSDIIDKSLEAGFSFVREQKGKNHFHIILQKKD